VMHGLELGLMGISGPKETSLTIRIATGFPDHLIP
jgi:hypothetical protein